MMLLSLSTPRARRSVIHVASCRSPAVLGRGKTPVQEHVSVRLTGRHRLERFPWGVQGISGSDESSLASIRMDTHIHKKFQAIFLQSKKSNQ